MTLIFKKTGSTICLFVVFHWQFLALPRAQASPAHEKCPNMGMSWRNTDMSNGNVSCRKNPFQDSAFVIQRLSRLIEKKVNRTGLFSAIAEEFRAVFQYDRLSIYLYEADREFLHTFAMPDGTGVEIFSNSRISHQYCQCHNLYLRNLACLQHCIY